MSAEAMWEVPMPEYVRITFPTVRQVWVDGQPSGFTNKEFQVEAGEHRFDLGDPRNYTPDRHVETVSNTLPGNPMTIAFKLIP